MFILAADTKYRQYYLKLNSAQIICIVFLILYFQFNMSWNLILRYLISKIQNLQDSKGGGGFELSSELFIVDNRIDKILKQQNINCSRN